MAKTETRIQAIQAFLLIGAFAMVGRAGYLQLVRGGDYAKRAARQRTEHKILEAPRGVIYDRGGTPLASSLERYHVTIAPEQVRDQNALLRIYRTDIGGRVDRLSAALRSGDPFYAHGPFTAGQMRRLREVRGVYLAPIYRREYPSGPLARPLIGSLTPDSSSGATGLERFLDSLLRGVPGETVLLKDARGRTYESPERVVRMPTRGHDVVLTIDKELQEIAEGGLAAAFETFDPKRGDIIFLDPRTGEVLAAASREVGTDGEQMASASYFTSAFEPGSTAKPLTAAALLALDRVGDDDTVSPENGRWAMPGRSKPIVDDHPQKVPVNLARAIQVSSNVAMAKFSTLLKPAEHFDALRKFGLGSPTGVEFPFEEPGILPEPHTWRAGGTGPSAAMGYAVMVTPVQLAAAYAALANDGRLLAPSIIKEIRRPDGEVIYRHQPTLVRQAVSAEVAAKLRRFLALSAGDSGTGGRAQVKGSVLGKTGTAKLVENRRYTNKHAASFAGMYPARDPQLVFVVRIEDPQGAYSGGAVAAPVVAGMLRQALAARRTTLDRGMLAESPVERPRSADPRLDGTERTDAQWVTLPLAPARPPPGAAAEVPNVIGQTVRSAAVALHRRGFRIRLEGAGTVVRMSPRAGDSLGAGKVVTLTAAKDPRS